MTAGCLAVPARRALLAYWGGRHTGQPAERLRFCVGQCESCECAGLGCRSVTGARSALMQAQGFCSQ